MNIAQIGMNINLTPDQLSALKYLKEYSAFAIKKLTGISKINNDSLTFWIDEETVQKWRHSR